MRFAQRPSWEVSEVFTQSVAFVQWGKTFMTLGQNVLLSCFPTVHRVYIAMVVMFCGTMIPPLFVFTFGSHWIGCVGWRGLVQETSLLPTSCRAAYVRWPWLGQ